MTYLLCAALPLKCGAAHSDARLYFSQSLIHECIVKYLTSSAAKKTKFNRPQDGFGWERVTHGDQLASNQYVMMKSFTRRVVKLNVEVSGFPPTRYWVSR